MGALSSNILTIVPALPARSKIIFPSAPSLPPQPTIVPGTGASPSYYVYGKTTWIVQTQDGTQYESMAGPEGSCESSSGYSITINAPTPPIMPYAVVGWRPYLSLSSQQEQLQQVGIVALGANWTVATGAIAAGQPTPPGWGNELIFRYPARQLPYYNPEWHGHDDYSTAGWQQSIVWYIDSIVDFEIPYIDAGNDAWAWKQFLGYALHRGPFDFYPDATLGTFMTLINMDTNPKMAYRNPGLYSLRLKCRQVILQS